MIVLKLLLKSKIDKKGTNWDLTVEALCGYGRNVFYERF